MASRDRSASLPALFVARQQRVDPQIDPELGRAPVEGRRKNRRPSMLDALVPKATIPAAAPGPESPEHAWEALCQKAKQLAKPDLDATPPLSIEDIRRAALTEWVAEVGNAITGGGEMSQYQIEVFMAVARQDQSLAGAVAGVGGISGAALVVHRGMEGART